MDMTSKKKTYVPPLLELFEYAVERGFAYSVKGDTKPDKISEINEYTGVGGSAGENQTGDWNVEWS